MIDIRSWGSACAEVDVASGIRGRCRLVVWVRLFVGAMLWKGEWGLVPFSVRPSGGSWWLCRSRECGIVFGVGQSRPFCLWVAGL